MNLYIIIVFDIFLHVNRESALEGNMLCIFSCNTYE